MWLSNTIPVGTGCYTHAIPTETTLELVENRVILVEITKLQKMRNSSNILACFSLDTDCIKTELQEPIDSDLQCQARYIQ